MQAENTIVSLQQGYIDIVGTENLTAHATNFSKYCFVLAPVSIFPSSFDMWSFDEMKKIITFL